MYKYGIPLTPGLAEVSSTLPVLTSFLAAGFRARGSRGIPALRTSYGVLPSMPQPRWGLRVL